ncbi:Serine/threonine-protein kinase gad8 [Penicillium diatomitis]|uniref:Serine/threonine-protein kinase gad8 n=1 Tax=Penicillium diatomitis TaxID=2819901 RepID=A0A9W9X655_9EURO|nr:Serine/threonine-protein kinase gad8 [Penicillium diatomitis]KAJ5485193.1 Serine/threonine-protein kinase gad8 [Penicillium diatomitis]
MLTSPRFRLPGSTHCDPSVSWAFERQISRGSWALTPLSCLGNSPKRRSQGSPNELTDCLPSTSELKETHLAPLATFGRSSSTSTIKNESHSNGGDETPASVQANNSTTPTTSSNGIAASESLVSPPVAPVKPGILIVTLHEGQGFSLSPHYQQIFNSHFQNNSYAPSSLRPSTSSSSHSSHGQAGSFVQSSRPQSTSGGLNAPTIHGRYSTKYLPYALLDFEKNQVFVDAVSGTPDAPLWAGDSTAFKFDVSRKTELNVQLYLRNPAARPGAGRSEDIFLGATKVHPRFEEAGQSYVDARDTDNFDKEFTGEMPQDSYVDGPALSQTMQQQFAGWSYNRPVAGLGDAGGSVKDPSFGSIPE